MFIRTQEPDQRCSKCQALNLCDRFLRGNEYIIRCRICGHEKVTGTVGSSTADSGPVHYSTTPIPAEETF